MRNLLLLHLWLFGFGVHQALPAQGHSYYFNEWWEECEEEYQVYYMEILSTRDHTLVKTFHSESKHPIRQAAFKAIDYSMGGFEFIDSVGYWTFWHPNGALASEWDCDADPVKIMKCWSPEGEQTVKEGNGYYHGYNERGNLISEGKLVGGLKEGEWKFYQEHNGETFLWKEEHYAESVLYGLSKGYYYNGTLRWEGWNVSGGKNGVWNWWKPGGERLAAHTYRRQDDNEFTEPDLDSLPRPIELYELQKKIGYPSMCKEAEIEGRIRYRFLISPTGDVVKRERIEEAHHLLMKPVERYIDELKFKPGLLGSEPQEMWVNVLFYFRLLK